MLLVLILLQLADIVTTAIGLKLGAEEANPIARWLLGVIENPVVAMILGKLVLGAPIALFAWLYPSWWPFPALYCAGLAWVVASNLKVIRGMRNVR